VEVVEHLTVVEQEVQAVVLILEDLVEQELLVKVMLVELPLLILVETLVAVAADPVLQVVQE
tara:strand:- start:335 stop:520 length:186 start_codon:yes stop_codon:yes gene_type:complete